MSPQVCQTSTVELGANILHEMCPPHGYFITDIINIIGTKLLKEKKVNAIIIIKTKKTTQKQQQLEITLSTLQYYMHKVFQFNMKFRFKCNIIWK